MLARFQFVQKLFEQQQLAADLHESLVDDQLPISVERGFDEVRVVGDLPESH